jgi:hypothetical protein
MAPASGEAEKEVMTSISQGTLKNNELILKLNGLRYLVRHKDATTDVAVRIVPLDGDTDGTEFVCFAATDKLADISAAVEKCLLELKPLGAKRAVQEIKTDLGIID